MDDPILHDRLELFFRHTESRLNLLERLHEIGPLHTQVLYII
jgi:hypothetical protein